jgi:hypothetical protein
MEEPGQPWCFIASGMKAAQRGIGGLYSFYLYSFFLFLLLSSLHLMPRLSLSTELLLFRSAVHRVRDWTHDAMVSAEHQH